MAEFNKTHNAFMAAMKKDAALFYAAFFIMVFAKAFGLYVADKLYYVLFAISGLLLACRLLLLVKDREVLLKSIAILLPCAIFFLNARETTLLFTCLFLAASKEINFEACMKSACGIYIVAICLRVVLYFCGVVEGGEKAIVANASDGTPYVVGYTYGYGYVTPNIFFAVVFVAVLLVLYVRKDKLDWVTITLTGIVALIVFLATKCKTGFVVYLGVLGAIAMHKLFPKRRKYLHAYCLLLVVISLFVGILLPFLRNLDNSSLMNLIDRILSGRLRISAQALRETGISFWGSAGWALDIMYMDVLFNCGTVGFAMVIAGGTALVWAFLKEEEPVGLICVCALILYASMEQFPLNIAMNPFLLYLGTNVIFKRKIV